jgi:hypothetical protein
VVPAAVTAPTLVAATFAADELTFTYTGGTGATKLAIRVGQADLTQSPWVFVDSPPALDGDVTIPFVPAEYGDGTILDPVAQNLRVRLGNEVSSVQSGNFVAITAP